MDELERIAAAFPGLTWSRARRITEGWDHVVVVLDEALVFRFPQEAPYAQALGREIAVLDHLAPRLPVRIPRYDRVAPDGSFAGYPLLPGRTLQPEVLASLDGTARDALVDQLAGFLSALHTAPVPGTPLEQVPASFLAEDQDDVRSAAAVHLPAVLTPAELDEVARILADVDALLAADLPEVVVHNDVYSRHLLWDDDDARLGVIDFSDMCVGDPAVDFAELHEYGEDFVRAVHERYTGPRDPGLLDRAWTYQRWIGVYMLTDHFDVGKTTWEVARETFDRVRRGR
ncbi:phosphotransferase family protein [Kocuria rosea]|jgi:aminoglycoside phosphotransferase (APT) family kinase protein|uniref:phosphotransferase family protein n=1 Tax=Kocuria rosea TaxID=1275 RepID=UPI0025B7887F|nr:phosphotransferase [Kocuria rosea]WJZ66392.1 phosphotransferase [Kocuria rosea]